MKLWTMTILVLIYSFLATPGFSTTFIVDPMPGAGDFTTIQDCIDSEIVLNDDTCMVNPGRYVENISNTYRVFVNGNGNVNIVSNSGPDQTIIDAGDPTLSVMYLYGFNGVVDGFTITSSDPAAQGGGIHCEDCNPTIKNCKIVGNEGDDGGIYVNDCGLTIINSTIADNYGSRGGGIFVWTWRDDMSITNSTIANNRGEICGGICYSSGSPLITNSIIWGNSPEQVSGYPDDVDDPTHITFSDIMGGWPGTGNIDGDPLFRDAANGDYHLAAGSPCIDTGDNSASDLPAADIDGQGRVFDGDRDSLAVVDMGADEFVCFISAAADF